MRADLRESLSKCNDLPSIPSVAIKIIEFVRSRVDDVLRITKLIEQDPVLAAKLMKYANSALYGQRRKYRKIQDAVVLFGPRNTLNIGLTFSLVSSLQAQQNDRMDYVRFWKRSLLAATYAQSIARHICSTSAEEALLASLLQDIGMLALDRLEPTLYPPIKDAGDYHDAARTAEHARLAVDHAAVGWWLLDSWGLPDMITNAVERSHYSFAPILEGPFNAFDKCIVLSGLIADIWLNDNWICYLNRALAFGHTWLDLATNDFMQILGAQGPQISEFETLFKIELLHKRKTDEILRMATHLISGRED